MTALENVRDIIDNLEYQHLISLTIRSHVKSALKLRGCRLVHCITTSPDDDFADRVEDAVAAGQITADQWYELQGASAILRTMDKIQKQGFAVAEISLTVREEVIARAEERAAILQQATGVATHPVVVGSRIPQLEQTGAGNITIIAIKHRDQ